MPFKIRVPDRDMDRTIRNIGLSSGYLVITVPNLSAGSMLPFHRRAGLPCEQTGRMLRANSWTDLK